MRVLFYKLLFCLFSLFSVFVYAQDSTLIEQANQAFEQGHFEKAVHHWKAALAILSETKQDSIQLEESRLEGFRKLALSYQMLGFYEEAFNALQQALAIANQIKNNTNQAASKAIIFSEIGDLYLATSSQNQPHNEKKAEQCLQEAQTLAGQFKEEQPRILAQVLNKQGNRLTMLANKKQAQYQKAINTYQKSKQWARKANDPLLVAKVKINIAEATFLRHSKPSTKNSRELVITTLETALQATQQLSPSYEQLFGLLALGRIAIQIYEQFSSKPILLLSYNALEQARQMATQFDNDIALSYAYGYLGKVYFLANRYAEAVRLTRQALFFAQQTPLFEQTFLKEPLPEHNSLPELNYRWSWQLARLFKAQGHRDEAIKKYKKAIIYMQPIRKRLLETGYRSQRKAFREAFAPLYFEPIELLIQRSTEKSEKREDNQSDLRDILYILEHFKIAELQNYFLGTCLGIAQQDKIEDQVDKFLDQAILKTAKTAILYPILLSKSSALLLVFPHKLYLFPIQLKGKALPGKKLSKRAEFFANELTAENSKLLNAKRLYNMLMRPIEATLKQNKIHTLVVVPDGKLRNISFAALHDGKDFLIKNYAVVVTQALALTKLDERSRYFVSIFLGGVSDAVQNFDELPNVPWELASIEKLYSGENYVVKKLLNNHFKKEVFEEEIRKNRYIIVHIASHGRFESDPSKSFLLTYDKKLKIYRLEKLMQFQDFQNTGSSEETIYSEKSICEIPASSEGKTPKNAKTAEKTVEELIWYKDYPFQEEQQIYPDLLTLSACETAEGNEDAALGLAGVTVKVGVKSALANLWKVDDEASSLLSVKFYEKLQNPNLTKAQALQKAQQELMEIEKFQHPYYWAPLILIGNWR